MKEYQKNTRYKLKTVIAESDTTTDNKTTNISSNLPASNNIITNISSNLSASNNKVKIIKKYNKVNSLDSKNSSVKKNGINQSIYSKCKTEENKNKSCQKLKIPPKMNPKKVEAEIVNEVEQKNPSIDDEYIDERKSTIDRVNINNVNYIKSQSMNRHMPNYVKPFSKINKYSSFKHNKYISNRNEALSVNKKLEEGYME